MNRLSRVVLALNRPCMWLHEMAHYLAARALGIPAERHAHHITFYPDDGRNAAIAAVILAPCAVGLVLGRPKTHDPDTPVRTLWLRATLPQERRNYPPL